MICLATLRKIAPSKTCAVPIFLQAPDRPFPSSRWTNPFTVGDGAAVPCGEGVLDFAHRRGSPRPQCAHHLKHQLCKSGESRPITLYL